MGRPVVRFEVGCTDAARTADFYARLFDWDTRAEGMAVHLDTGAGRGIDGQATALGHEPRRFVMFYVEVERIEDTLAQAERLGGHRVVGPAPLPAGGRFAWVSDLDGNLVGLVEASPQTAG